MYVQGNLAVRRKEKEKVVIREERRTVRRKKPIPLPEKLLYLVTIVACVLVAGLIILRYAQIYEVNARLHQLEKEIQQYENQNNTMRLEVNQLANPERLIERAKQLGMRPSTESDLREIPHQSALGHDEASLAYKR